MATKKLDRKQRRILRRLTQRRLHKWVTAITSHHFTISREDSQRLIYGLSEEDLRAFEAPGRVVVDENIPQWAIDRDKRLSDGMDEVAGICDVSLIMRGRTLRRDGG